jgi:hypothetical protein
MKTLHKIASFLLLSLFLSIAVPVTTNAQCAMCKLNAEHAAESKNKKQGLTLNSGILILLSMPYAIVGIVGFMWYKRSRRGEE